MCFPCLIIVINQIFFFFFWGIASSFDNFKITICIVLYLLQLSRLPPQQLLTLYLLNTHEVCVNPTSEEVKSEKILTQPGCEPGSPRMVTLDQGGFRF